MPVGTRDAPSESWVVLGLFGSRQSIMLLLLDSPQDEISVVFVDASI